MADIPYNLTATSIDELVNQFNPILASISDRLDKMEGLRGDPEMESFLTMKNKKILIVDKDGNILHQFGDTT